MTSPAQLKYLDAMGIPVWVSRDLVVVDEKDISVSEVGQSQSGVSPDRNSDQPNNVKNILASLDAHESKKVAAKNETTLETVVAESVNKASVSKINESYDKSLSSTELTQLNTENLLFKSAYHYMYAQGSESADWLVIGHSPEAFSGIGQEPFATDAGLLLDNMLRAVGIEQPRQQAYIVNVLDVDQSINESPQTEANELLKQKLLSVIDLVKPKVLLLVGQIAAQNLLDSSDPLIIMRSKSHKITKTEIPCVVTYYPSYLLLKPIDKRKAWEDLKLAMRLLDS